MTIISGKILKLNGWPEGPVIRVAKDAAQALWEAGLDRDAILARLDVVRENPTAFANDETVGELARELLALTAQATEARSEELRGSPLSYRIWGKEFIDAGALAQMDNALRLPVSVAGALMPDAHVGYGLPIGGVLATEGTVIPYAVGVDIACRMRLSVYEASPIVLGQKPGQFEKALLSQTRFGIGAKWNKGEKPEHPVLDDEDWLELPLLRHLLDTAANQIGTSGTGNHFVEWGTFELTQPDEKLNLPAGQYLALLSHSGSRGVGFKIADHYSKLAMELHPKLDKAVRHLAWLDLDKDAGREYWLAMELAGRFASANHYVIHHRVAAAAGLKEVAAVENHHNFCISGDAWVPTPEGPRRMDDIKVGNFVYAFDAKKGLIPTQVLCHAHTGKKRIRSIRTASRTLRVSFDHPVQVIDIKRSTNTRLKSQGYLNWKRAEQIQKGDIIICADGYYSQQLSIGEDRARLIGAFLGDGWIRHDTSHGRYTVGLAIGRADEPHTRRYLTLLQQGLPAANWSNNTPGAFGLTCASMKVWRAVKALGLEAYSTEKRVPNLIYKISIKEKLAFLAGYVDADGSIAKASTSNWGRATIATTNANLAQELREVALACGLRATSVRAEIMKSNFGDTISYRFVLSADSTAQLDLWHVTKAANQRVTRFQKPKGLQLSKTGYLPLPKGVFAQSVLATEDAQWEEDVYDLTVAHPSHSFVVEGVVVHNCWRETLPDGRKVMVHRKGATPAGVGVLGVIPGSMGDAGYVVRGRGVAEALNSASHGAGRQMSRKQALNSITKHARDAYLNERAITLLGGGLDESPQAYKRIQDILGAQDDLVEVLGKFTPKIVRMADEAGEW